MEQCQLVISEKVGQADQRREAKVLQDRLKELLSARCESFPAPRCKIAAPNQKGVYIIYSPRGKVLHVGSTPFAMRGIAQRLCDHLAGRSSFTIAKFSGDGSQLRNGYRFRYLVVKDDRQRALLEALCIGRLCPEHIGHGRDRSLGAAGARQN